MGANNELGNAAHLMKGSVKQVAGKITGNESLEASGREEAHEAKTRQAAEIGRPEREEGDSPEEPSSSAESVLADDKE